MRQLLSVATLIPIMVFVYPYQMSAHLIASGEDAAEFLQSQFSCDLRPFRVGHAVYGLWLDVKGKVIADSWVLCVGAERFHIFSEHCDAGIIAQKLEQHVIADDVVIELAPSAPALSVIGTTEEAMAADFPGFALLPGRRARLPSVEAIFNSATARDTFVAVLDAQRLADDRLQLLRMEAGVPRIPDEVGPGELPGEAGLDGDAVDFNKGCFLGQEVVARMRNLGKPTRALYQLRGSGPLPDCPAALTLADGKVVGELRSVVRNGSDWRGVALIKIRHVAAGVAWFLAGAPVENLGLFSRSGSQ